MKLVGDPRVKLSSPRAESRSHVARAGQWEHVTPGHTVWSGPLSGGLSLLLLSPSSSWCGRPFTQESGPCRGDAESFLWPFCGDAPCCTLHLVRRWPLTCRNWDSHQERRTDLLLRRKRSVGAQHDVPLGKCEDQDFYNLSTEDFLEFGGQQRETTATGKDSARRVFT